MKRTSPQIDVNAMEPSFARSELILSRQLSNRIAGRFYAAHVEKKQKRLPPGTLVRYALHHFALFCFVSAASGVIGNASYAAISKLIRSIRRPSTELLPSKTTFEAVVSRTTYNQIRREKHPGTRAKQRISVEAKETIEKTYELTLAVKKTAARNISSRKKQNK